MSMTPPPLPPAARGSTSAKRYGGSTRGSKRLSVVALALAIAAAVPLLALALGLSPLLLLVGVLLGGVAMVLGIVCVFGKRGGKGLAIGAMVIGIGLAAAETAVVGMWGLGRARDGAMRSSCGVNLHAIGQGIIMYQVEYGDAYPDDLAHLVGEGTIGMYTFRCPSAREEEGAHRYIEVTDPALREHLDYELDDHGRYRCDYFYLPPEQPEPERPLPETPEFGTDLPPMERYPDVPATTIVACDLRGNHEDGRNVLYADAHVQWCEEGEFQRELDKPANRRFAEALREHEGR